MRIVRDFYIADVVKNNFEEIRIVDIDTSYDPEEGKLLSLP